MGFVNWLKYIFLGFFSDKVNKEGSKRNPLNILTQLLLVIVLLTLPLYLGIISCFDAHYKDLGNFKDYSTNLFTNSDLTLKVEIDDEGTAFAKVYKDGNEVVVDTFKNASDSKYAKDGYNVVIDTRNPENLYPEFDVIYTKDGEADLTFDEYKNGSYSGYTGSYDFHLDENGYIKLVDTEALKNDYYVYLQVNNAELSSTLQTSYAALAEMDQNSKEFADEVYSIYTCNKYSLSLCPTISYYYENEYGKTNNMGLIIKEDFIFIGYTYLIASTHKDNGQVYNFYGYYDKFLEEITINDQASIDYFYKTTYDSLGAYQLLLSGYNVFNFMIFFIITAIFLSLMLFAFFKLTKNNNDKGFFACLNFANNFLPISALIGGLGGFIVSFIISSNLATIFACYFGLGVYFARTIIFAIMELVKARKEKQNEELAKKVENIEESPIEM